MISLPTGAGKSLCIAMLARDALVLHGARSLVLAHRKELLVQNAEKIRALLPDVRIGVYSAGLKCRDTDSGVILAGIQSVYNKAHEFGVRNLIVNDECHLCPPDGEGMYRQFYSELGSLNPGMRAVGLSASPYRTGGRSLCSPDGLYQKICYSAPMARLIGEGFLSNLTTLPADATIDTSKLKVRGGEFVHHEMEKLFDDDKKVEAACREIVDKTHGRKSILLFCAGVAHAEHVSRRIEDLTGEECGLVTGGTLSLERSATLQRFKDGQLRWLCNVDVLTTGFDAPCIDAIAILRATDSAGLMAQICGRGLRIWAGKSDCLILDFGENIARHGPLDAEDFGQRRQKRKGNGGGDAPTKRCPSCDEPNPLTAKVCAECGWNFPRETQAPHGVNADGSAILEKDVKADKWLVESVAFARHKKKGGEPTDPDTLRVDYMCKPVDQVGNLTAKRISEWVCLEHENWARNNALKWWRERSNAPVDGIDDAISLLKRGAVAMPRTIETKVLKGFPRVVGYELDEKPETWQEEQVVEEGSDGFDAFDAFDDVPF